jgi:hypothetical protein
MRLICTWCHGKLAVRRYKHGHKAFCCMAHLEAFKEWKDQEQHKQPVEPFPCPVSV